MIIKPIWHYRKYSVLELNQYDVKVIYKKDSIDIIALNYYTIPIEKDIMDSITFAVFQLYGIFKGYTARDMLNINIQNW